METTWTAVTLTLSLLGCQALFGLGYVCYFRTKDLLALKSRYKEILLASLVMLNLSTLYTIIMLVIPSRPCIIDLLFSFYPITVLIIFTFFRALLFISGEKNFYLNEIHSGNQGDLMEPPSLLEKLFIRLCVWLRGETRKPKEKSKLLADTSAYLNILHTQDPKTMYRIQLRLIVLSIILTLPLFCIPFAVNIQFAGVTPDSTCQFPYFLPIIHITDFFCWLPFVFILILLKSTDNFSFFKAELHSEIAVIIVTLVVQVILRYIWENDEDSISVLLQNIALLVGQLLFLLFLIFIPAYHSKRISKALKQLKANDKSLHLILDTPCLRQELKCIAAQHKAVENVVFLERLRHVKTKLIQAYKSKNHPPIQGSKTSLTVRATPGNERIPPLSEGKRVSVDIGGGGRVGSNSVLSTYTNASSMSRLDPDCLAFLGSETTTPEASELYEKFINPESPYVLNLKFNFTKPLKEKFNAKTLTVRQFDVVENHVKKMVVNNFFRKLLDEWKGGPC